MPTDVLDLPIIGRAGEVRPQSIDTESRTVEIVWTTGARVRRMTWEDGEVDEELAVDAQAMRLERLNAGAPFLNSHRNRDLAAILGVVVEGSVRIEGGRGYAQVRFSERADVEPIWRDIVGGIIRNVSVGYRVHRYEVEKRDGQRPLYRAVDWEPMELSAVAIGADPGAHIRSEDGPGGASSPCVVIRHDGNAAAAAHEEEAEMPEETPNAAGGNQATGRSTGPAESQAQAVQQSRAADPAPAPAAVDAERIRSEERERVTGIGTLCRQFGIGADVEADLVRTGATIDVARERVLAELARRDNVSVRRAEPAPAQANGSRLDETETRRRAMQDVLTARLSSQEIPEHAREYADHSLVDLAAVRLGEARVPGSFGGREALLQRAFHSTGDFPLLFENALNQSLAARYRSAEPTYRRIARQRSYQDFREHGTVRVGDFPTLQPVDPEAGELKSGTFSEAKERTSVKAYGVAVRLSRAMLVNDSLNGIMQVLNDRGMAVARFEDQTFYAMMLSGSNADGPSLLETTRQVFNTTDVTKAGTAAKIDVASLSIARAALRKRTSLDGAKLSLSARILLVGPDKETEAQQVVAPIQAQQAGNVNPFSGTMEVVVSPEISGNAWYVFANPGEAPCFEWGLLDGYDAPRFRLEEVFGRQGTQLSLEHDFGCGAIDFRGGFKNAGA